jgi:chemotaxis protein methyltransferase CheR
MCETVVTRYGVFYRRKGLPFSLPAELRTPLPEVKPVVELIPIRVEPAIAALPEQDVDAPVPEMVDAIAETVADVFSRGDYAQVAGLMNPQESDPLVCALYVRALANLGDLARAEKTLAEFLRQHTFSCELRYLRVVLLLELGNDAEALLEAERTLYLDRSLAVVHFAIGTIRRRQGDLRGARRAFRNVHELCAERPTSEIVPLSDGESAQRLADAAVAQLKQLDSVLDNKS